MFVECSVYNILHVVASAGTGGRLGPMAIHAFRPAEMHKFQSLLTYVKHVQSPGVFQDTLYIVYTSSRINGFCISCYLVFVKTLFRSLPFEHI